MSITSVRLQPDLEDQLQTMAGTLQRSKNWLINQAIREFVQRQALADKRWTQTLVAIESAAQGKVVAGSEVHDWLASWGKPDELAPPKISK